jgi:DNA gyrase subunit A
MDEGDFVVAADVIHEQNRKHALLTVSTAGLGKRTRLSEFRIQGRGGSGIIAMKLTNNSKVAGAAIVHDKHDVVLISSAGVVIRTKTDQISTVGRSTQGVQVMKVGSGVEVASMTVLEESEEAVIEDLGPSSPVTAATDGQPTNGRRPRRAKTS